MTKERIVFNECVTLAKIVFDTGSAQWRERVKFDQGTARLLIAARCPD
jgi:hypothetical protein